MLSPATLPAEALVAGFLAESPTSPGSSPPLVPPLNQRSLPGTAGVGGLVSEGAGEVVRGGLTGAGCAVIGPDGGAAGGAGCAGDGLGRVGDAAGGAGFTGAGLDGAGFTGAGLDGAGFTGAGLDGAGFTGAGLDGAGFTGAGLDGAGFDGAGLDGGGVGRVGGAAGGGDDLTGGDGLPAFCPFSVAGSPVGFCGPGASALLPAVPVRPGVPAARSVASYPGAVAPVPGSGAASAVR
jgi:hypothetical protein